MLHFIENVIYISFSILLVEVEYHIIEVDDGMLEILTFGIAKLTAYDRNTQKSVSTHIIIPTEDISKDFIEEQP